MISLEDQPEDHIRHICSFLSFNDILYLENVSKRFSNVKKYIICIKLNCKIFNKDQLDSLCKVIKGSSLQTLDLRCNNICVEGVKCLGPFLHKSLQILYLGYNNIGDEGVKYLGPFLPKSLLTLDLRWNNINVEGIKCLEPFLPNSLQSLNLEWNTINAEGVKCLGSFLPKSYQIIR